MDFSKKRGKLKPLFDLNINETLPFKIHPLYNQKKAQHAKICQFLKEKASKARIPFDLLPDHITEVDAIPIAQEKYISEIKKHAQKIAPPPLNIEWENKILNLIPKSVKTKFPNELLNVFKECKTEWNFCLQNLIVKTIIRDLPGALSERYQEKHFKFGGKTEYYAQFLKTKKILEQNLLIMYPFMRLILESSVRAFPLHLVRFDLYRTNEFIRIERLLDVFHEDLKRSESLIVDVWYPDLISNFKLPFNKALSSNKRVLKFYNCATNSISMQIVELMRRSIEFLIHVIGSPERTPRIKMELRFESGIVLSPSFDEIFHCYHGMLKAIASISQNLTTLEQLENVHDDNKYVRVQINDWLYKDCHDRLQAKLNDVFQPVRDYIENLKSTYSELFDISDGSNNAIDSSQSYDKIKRYKEIGESLSLMVENEYFTVGKIHQARLINSLKNCCDDLKNEILNSLCLSHEQNSRNICATFETIASKVLKTPFDAAELLEIGSYCLYVKTELVEELRERISISITDMSQLIDLAVLSIDHINVNTKMINWLNEIVPILEKSAIDYETSKYDMEENLLVKTNSLAKKVSDILPYLDILDEMDDINKTLPYLEDIRRLVHWINDCDTELAWINKEETVFKFPLTQFSDLDELKGYVLPFYELMYLLHTWRRRYYSWMDGPFENIDRVKVEHQHEEYYKKFTKIFKDYKNKIKQQIADNNERRFKGLVEDPDPMNLPAPMKLCAQAINELKEWRPWVHLVNIVCNPALRQRHWDDMSKIADLDLTPDAGTTIRKMIKLDLWTEMQKYEIVSIGASKELTLITNLDEMISQWKDVNFHFGTYKDTGIQILTQLDDVQAVLDDHIIKTISMRGSPFVKPFEVQVKSWYEKLLRINSSIDEWIKVQQRWLYFLPLFSSKNIVSQMPQEGHMFQEVDKTYNKYMQVVENNPLVIDSAGEFELLDAMTMANNLLEKISNGVNDYVEKKRLYFPRFFFLSVDEILEILSETENPIKVQPYLKKCFEGINKLEFDDDLNILAMISKEYEKIAFRQTISTKEASGSVEKWLLQVEQRMIESVRSEIELSYFNYASLERELWVKDWEGMVVLCVAQIYWALNVHDCFKTNALQNLNEFLTTLKSQLNNLVNIIRSSSLTNINRITIKALIVIDVHAKDVIQELIDKNVNNEADFNWLAQLRYYWEDDNVNVKIINAVVKFAYEYLGNTDRLVITPLTDRCYRTLIGAYSLQLNGAPEGPAGTGKTETTKDLAKAIAKQCIVFNCSDGLDYKGMGRFFKGLASTGAWACFDEFNRIDVEVLSVVAQQILCIIQAIRKKSEKFLFEGTLLTLNQTCYVCITMNPGYAGRSELPDNLKVLFRPVAMMVPDYAMIGEISLYSYGFLDARKLAVKIVAAYRLCSEQLSSQNHYDYGMRAVKSVLSACGGNKMKFPDENEDVLLLRSLTDINLPKFLTKDIPLFNGIVSDLFPGINIPSFDSPAFIEIIKNKCLDLNLELTDYFLLKIIQTNQMMLVRHGFMLVGNPFSGKTSVLKVLYEAICCLNNENDRSFCIVNPKSLTSEQIFGCVDRTTLEWCDGVISKVFREYAKDDRLHRKWIIFDGPVDAVWIENMNTVLDDNKKLCLSSGEVISMSDSMSLIFEVMDLAQASPATVSRCGMIYMESSILGPSPFSKSWVKECNSSWKIGYENLLVDMCDWLFPTLLSFLKKINIPIITGGDMNLVISTLQIVNMVMNDAVSNEEDTKYLKTWIQASFIFGIVWGFGGNLSADSKVKFEEFVREIWKSDQNIPETLEKIDVSIPMEGLLSDYIYQYKQKGNWKHWQEIVKSTKLIETSDLQQTIIPTADSVKCAYLLDLHVRHRKPMLFVGKTGTGKTFYTRDYIMNKLSIEQYTPVLMTFTVTTSANQTQETLLSKLYKHKGNRYGPRKGKEAIVFIDDMSMPAKEIYGAQPAIELLRQYLDHKHWYHLKTSERIDIVNVLILAAVGPVGGSKQLIYPRLLRHFNIFAVNEFSEDSVMKIFTNILQIGWKRNGFGNDVTPITVSIVNGTLDVYTSVVNNLLPTISKAHYLFNIRDIGRVIQGCLLLKKESADNKKYFVKLWIHETLRVFYDRFTNVSDREWFYSVLKRCTTDHFKEELASMCDNYQDDNGNVTENSLKNLMFGTYLDVESMDDDKKYEEIPNISIFLKKAVDTLEDYNSANKNKINIVLFQYALEHLSKICRIISIPGGNALLIGVGGSGRQSLTKLASYMIGNSVFQPEITKNYDLNSWRSDIKKLLKQAGGLPKETTFLFSEGQILNEIFLQDIDNLLNSGEVPNLFELDEQQEILELVRLAAQGGNRNLDIHPLNVMSFFIARCRAKLHLCVCLSPVSNTFRDKLRLYPSLINCCTVDWFDDWPEDALLRVAEHIMEDINITDQVKSASIQACKYFHMNAYKISNDFYDKFQRRVFITSESYINLINLYAKLIAEKQNDLQLAKKRYMNGLDKLNLAAEAVSDMQKELNELKPQLIIMAVKGAEMMEEIERETIEADKATIQVREDEKIANEQAAGAQVLKKDCEADLALAIPILEDAIAALNTLKPTDITLVKSMKNPPAAIKLVMAAVCVMKSIPPDRIPDPANPGRKMLDFWGPSKRLLGDMAFLQSLKEFDKDNIPVVTMVKIRKEYLSHKDFKPSIIAKASTAAEGLCKWVIAMDMYDAVAKVVAPKKAKLQAAEAEFAATMAILEEKKAMVARLEKRVADLNAALEEANLKKQELEEEVQMCINKLYRAEKLIGGLGGEKSRWTSAAENLQNLYDNLAGDILLSCGIISYLSPFPVFVRSSAVTDWEKCIINLEIPFSDNFEFSKVLGSDLKIQNWRISGLPQDQISTDNAVIQDISTKWSLLIDPQGQAIAWLKKMEQMNDLRMLKLSDNDYMKTLQTCIEYGMPALIENIMDDLPAPLDPILMKNTYAILDKMYITIGDEDMEYHPKFRLYMTTKQKNPHYQPEVFIKVTVINFALSIAGLEDQLLGIVVAKERPDLQEKREQLIIETAQNTAELKNIENSILKTLQETKGDILEDEAAIEILDSSKVLSVEILERKKAAKETEIMIDKFRVSYQPIAKHAANVYYSVTDLSNIDPMYQYSLSWYVSLYKVSIEKANKSKELDRRLKFLIDTFTYNLYCNVCRSLFEKDKLMFSFILCSKMLTASHDMNGIEFNFFLTGGISVTNEFQNPFSWLPSKSWDEICRICEIDGFHDFRSSFVENGDLWKYIYDSNNPQIERYPPPWDKLSLFKKLLVIRMLRPDKLTDAITIFIEENLGRNFVNPPPFDIVKSYNESNCLVPIIFILSPGSDPFSVLQKFSEKMGYGKKLNSISLGQGQGPLAKALISQAQTEGGWVCLQNCHLAVSWFIELENVCESFDLTNTDTSFRLWLTTYSTDKFPQSILQSAIKMTNEIPYGLKNNLCRLYTSEPVKDPLFYGGCPENDKTFSKLLYSISFFHSVVQERKKFGPLGWNIPYSFDDSDFIISIKQLQNFLNQYTDVPYVALSYLIGECNYGGRVTDEWDRRLIVTILKEYLNSKIVNDSDYSFSNVSRFYNMPRHCEYQDYLKHIESIPQFEPPEVLGLHMNAGIFCDLNNSMILINALQCVEGESSGNSTNANTDDMLKHICVDIIERLPPSFDLEIAIERFPIDYHQSMNTFLIQEMEKYNKLIHEIVSSLENLQKGISGLLVMTPDMEMQGSFIFKGKCPLNWLKVSYPSLKSLGGYIIDLIERLKFLNDWCDCGTPKSFWISGFFFTQAFLTAGLQNFARRHSIPIDRLVFDCAITTLSDTDDDASVDSLFVYGLFLSGARWNDRELVLDEQVPKVLNEAMPSFRIYAVEKSKFDEGNRYKCPVYRTPERRGILATTGHSSNFVLSLMLPSDRTPSHWIKRSVAMILEQNE